MQIRRHNSPEDRITTGDYSPVFAPKIPQSTVELTIIIVLFMLLITSMLVNGIDYARGQRADQRIIASNEALKSSQDELTKAKTDLKTQIWLRSDSLTKENAELRAHLTTIEDLVQAYGIAKKLSKPRPLTEERP